MEEATGLRLTEMMALCGGLGYFRRYVFGGIFFAVYFPGGKFFLAVYFFAE